MGRRRDGVRVISSIGAALRRSRSERDLVMRTAATRSVSIVAQDDQPRLSKGQKTFNTLIRSIERQRALLEEWEQLKIAFQKRYTEEYLPLVKTLSERQRDMVNALDQAWTRKDLTRPEKRLVSDLIVSLIESISDDVDEEGLKTIYNRHSRSDFDTDKAAEFDQMKLMAEVLFDIELDDDVGSPDALAQRVAEKIVAERSEEADKAKDRTEAGDTKRKKSPKQLAAEARLQSEPAELSRSIREVYHRLAVALHPDREPDPQERARKTELMQRVNVAYSQKNLLQLLELQLELEHIDQRDINNISEGRLKHYNTILKEQLGELNQEIDEIQTSFCYTLDMNPLQPIAPKTVSRQLDADISEMRRSIRELRRDLSLCTDVRVLKQWLKTFKNAKQRDMRW
jgi:hypothetical protein